MSKIDNMSVSDDMSKTGTKQSAAISAARWQGARVARPAGIERPTRRSRKTRRSLIDAARTLLEEQGVAALTVKAVTERADVGHGTFYHHFASTEAVLAAGIEESMREFSQELERSFADSSDKSWVLVASLSSTFRMLAAHAALPWMLERPHLLAAALREACGPFARRDVEAMVHAGDVAPGVLAGAGRYWEWLIIGALTDAAGRPGERRRIEAALVEAILRMLGIGDSKVAALLAKLGGHDRRAKPA